MIPFILPPFPLSMLGRVLAPACSAHCSNTGVSAEMVGPMALGAAAGAVHDLVDVLRPDLPPSPVSLYVCLLAGSGQGKDVAIAPFVAPHRSFQVQADLEFDGLNADYEAKLEVWRLEERVLYEQIKADIRDGALATSREAAVRDLKDRRPAPPLVPKLLYADTTVTAMRMLLCERWGSGLFVSTEAGDLLNGRLGSEFPFWNSLWGGDPIVVDRVAEGSLSVADPRVGMVVGIQPELYRKFLLKRGDEAQGSGFQARVMSAWVPSTVENCFINGLPKDTSALEVYATRITELLSEAVERRRAGYPRRVLKFTPPAALSFQHMFNSIRAHMAPGQIYAAIRSQAAKAAENVARVAAVLHVLDDLSGDIDDATLHRAMMIVSWFLDQQSGILQAARFDPRDHGDAALVHQALVTAHMRGLASIAKNDIQYWVSQHMKPARISNGLRVLFSNRVALIGGRRNDQVALVAWCPCGNVGFLSLPGKK